jgi:hypothetical protein
MLLSILLVHHSARISLTMSILIRTSVWVKTRTVVLQASCPKNYSRKIYIYFNQIRESGLQNKTTKMGGHFDNKAQMVNAVQIQE